MKKLKIVVLMPLLLVCCSVYWIKGPVPGDDNYIWSVKDIPSYNEVKYISHGAFYPGVILGDMTSFGKPAVEGVSFIYNDKIIFAVYNKSTLSYIPQAQFPFSKITWFTHIKHGVTRIMRFKINEFQGSIATAYTVTSEGSEIDKEIVVNFVDNQINKKL